MNKKLMTMLAMSSMLLSVLAMPTSAVTSKQVMKDEVGQVHNVVGHLGKVSGATAAERALNALELVKGDFGIGNVKSNFKVQSSHQDEQAMTHTKLNHVMNGIKVFGEEMIVHEENGELSGVTGDFTTLTPNATTPDISSSTAIEKAVSSTGFKGNLTRPATSELMYLAKGNQALLTYAVHVSYRDTTAPASQLIFVDAHDGSIVQAISEQYEYTNTVGTGTGVFGTTRSINTTLDASTYYMEDHSKPNMQSNGIQTYDLRNGTTTGYRLTDSDNVWNTTSQRAAVDAHFWTGKVYDYWYTNWGRNSYDNAGAPMYTYVHYAMNYNNAYWDGTELVCGDGDGVTFRGLCSDPTIIAHEWMHAVVERTANLTYSNQSGALNEAICDAFAAAFANTWTMGGLSYTPATAGDGLRSLSNPQAYGQPATMSGYVNTTSDNGGVHTNMGIPNKAFYLASTASGMTSTVAMKIWYIALRDYMTSSTNFSGARAATLQAATTLYGAGSTQYNAVAAAWTSVGVN